MTDSEAELYVDQEELAEKHLRLDLFIKEGKIFPELEEMERARLRKQHFIMGEYLKVLDERIQALTQ